MWIGNGWDFAEITGLKKDARRLKLKEILGKLDIEENRVRERIFNGNFIYRETTWSEGMNAQKTKTNTK